MNYLLDAARSYLAAGLCPLPTRFGSKGLNDIKLERTYGADVFQRNPPGQLDTVVIPRLPTDAELMYWFNDSDSFPGQLAIATGAISGGLVVLDFDVPELYSFWREELNALQLHVYGLPQVRTPRGFHVYVRTGGDVPPTSSVATIPDRGWSLVDVRGEGGWVMAPPSMGGNDGKLPYTEPQRALPIVAVPFMHADDVATMLEAGKLPHLYRTEIDENWDDKRGTVGLTTAGITLQALSPLDHTPQSMHLSCEQALVVAEYLRRTATAIRALKQQLDDKRRADDYDYAMATSGGWYDDDDSGF